MKGIVLAGGKGTRLYPSTLAISKQLLPVYNRPMVYYPLATLMEVGIRDIYIITQEEDLALYQKLLGTGEQWGIQLSYGTQSSPRGIADALLVAEEFLAGDSFALILGDNLFWGPHLVEQVSTAIQKLKGATLFAQQRADVADFGVVEFDDSENPISLEEKPKIPRSHWALTGLYLYENKAVGLAKSLTPSARGELEITDLNQLFLQKGELQVEKLEETTFWQDAGSHDSLLDLGCWVRQTEASLGEEIANLDKIARLKQWV